LKNTLGMATFAPGMVIPSSGVPMQYTQQASMANVSQPVIQHNGKTPQYIYILYNIYFFEI
jgi:hypothetical protein